jgi:hypothetical protein
MKIRSSFMEVNHEEDEEDDDNDDDDCDDVGDNESAEDS